MKPKTNIMNILYRIKAVVLVTFLVVPQNQAMSVSPSLKDHKVLATTLALIGYGIYRWYTHKPTAVPEFDKLSEREQNQFIKIFREGYNRPWLGEWESKKEQVCAPDKIIKLALDEDTNGIIGFIIYSQSKDQGHIDCEAVTLSRKGQGISKKLASDAITDMKKRGAKTISSRLHEANENARYMYTTLGFTLKKNDGDHQIFEHNLIQ